MAIIVGKTERSELKAAMARARAHPLPWEVLKRRITEQDGTNTRHVEDQPLAHERPPAEFVDLPFGYVVAISFEEQPAGTTSLCLRRQADASVPHRTPMPPAMTARCYRLGSGLARLLRPCRIAAEDVSSLFAEFGRREPKRQSGPVER